MFPGISDRVGEDDYGDISGKRSRHLQTAGAESGPSGHLHGGTNHRRDGAGGGVLLPDCDRAGGRDGAGGTCSLHHGFAGREALKINENE